MTQESKTTWVVGITGGIGSGKSIVSRILRCNGFPVFDCDYEASYLMANNPEIKREIIEILGQESYLEERINKKFIASKIFSDIILRQKVNSIVHCAVRNEINKRISCLKEPVFFIESAILSTGGLAILCDRIWIVEAAEELRIRRVINRDNLSVSEIERRIKAQESELSQLPPSKITVINNNGMDSLLEETLIFTDKFNNIESLCLKKF